MLTEARPRHYVGSRVQAGVECSHWSMQDKYPRPQVRQADITWSCYW